MLRKRTGFFSKWVTCTAASGDASVIFQTFDVPLFSLR